MPMIAIDDLHFGYGRNALYQGFFAQVRHKYLSLNLWSLGSHGILHSSTRIHAGQCAWAANADRMETDPLLAIGFNLRACPKISSTGRDNAGLVLAWDPKSLQLKLVNGNGIPIGNQCASDGGSLVLAPCSSQQSKGFSQKHAV